VGNSVNLAEKLHRPVRLAYQPPANSTFLSEQTSHQQSASSTFLSEQISTSHQPNEQAVRSLHFPIIVLMQIKVRMYGPLKSTNILYSSPRPSYEKHIHVL
jgi:plasmid rolling circle replication initiator protein Rep